MDVVEQVLVPFIMTNLPLDEGSKKDSFLTLLNDIIVELFEKVRDIYCVLPSLSTITLVLKEGLSNQSVKESVFT